MRSFLRKFDIALVVAAALCVAAPAHAAFNVDWGTSNDTGNAGYSDLNSWFAANGYGSVNAQTDYIGYNAGDSDPFYFAPGNYNFEVLQQVAGNANLTSFGYYTGAGVGKTLTTVLGAGSKGPVNVDVASSFGAFIHAPKSFQSTHFTDWFTDRAENDAKQTGATSTNAGGDPQALIYRLNQTEWLLAWEDLDYSNTAQGQSDHDYNDAYVKVTVTPEPVSMALFGMGGALLAATGYRRRPKK